VTIPNDIIDASLQQSHLWNSMDIITLHQNMRLDSTEEEINFGQWLLTVGHGQNLTNDGCTILPKHIVNTDPQIFITKLYGDMFNASSPPPPQYFLDRAILAPKNKDVHKTNQIILDHMPGNEITFFSADNIIDEEGNVTPNQRSVPLEYLHSLQPAALPPSELKVKIGCPLILMRNLHPSQGLCNGTRLILLQAQQRVLEVRILGGDHNGDIALIPRIGLIPSTEEGYTFQFKRHQFPVRLAFAMTINKAEGQSLHTVGIDLRQPVFSHGQLYVALSRTTSSHRVHVLLPPNSENKTPNVVYPEVLLD